MAQNLKESASSEALCLPLPPLSITKMASPYFTTARSYVPTVLRCFGYLVISPVIIQTSFIKATWYTLESAAKTISNSHYGHTSLSTILQLPTNIKDNLNSFKKIFLTINDFYLEKFEKNRIPALAISSVAYLIIYYACQHFKLTTPKSIDKNEIFANANDQVRAGIIQKGRLRINEMLQLSNSLVRLPMLSVNIPFITGPSGVGKSELVKQFAWHCVNDRGFPHYGKTVFIVNTMKLLEKPKRLGEVINELREQNLIENVILFFDESHNGGQSKHAQKHVAPSGTNLLELFKTEILDNNISCIMATTNEEYETFIKPNTAFVSRTTPIKLPELSQEDTKDLLKEYVQIHLSSTFEVSQDRYDQIIKTGAEYPDYKERYQPRKSFQILQSVVAKSQIWNPIDLLIQLQNADDQERKLRLECAEKSQNDPSWTFSQEGVEKFKALKEKQQKIKDLEKAIFERRAQHEEIQKIRALFAESMTQLKRLVHQVAKENNPEVEKQYFYTKFVAVPALQRLLNAKMAAFNEGSKEKISLKIDAKFIEQTFKS